jgi:indole-3-glycerol phosphate synthase
MSVLEQIVTSTRDRIRSLPRPDRRAAEEARSGREPFAFRRAIERPGVNIIAEIKAASPSAGTILSEPDVEGIASDYGRGGAAAVSIVTEPDHFRGSTAWIGRARSAGLPLLMKDFVLEASQIVRGVAEGADAILLLASVLETSQLRDFTALIEAWGCDALVEVHDPAELEKALEAGARIIGVNNRDLRTFRVDLGTSETLSERMPAGILRVAESGIRTAGDVNRLRQVGFHAFLVGESLLRQNDRAAAVMTLRDGE